MRAVLFAALGALVGCGADTYDTYTCHGCGVVLDHDSVYAGDADGDGYAGDEDCDDANAEVNPSAAEACDGIDNDCDAEIDEAGC